jgi:hypothetical protein
MSFGLLSVSNPTSTDLKLSSSLGNYKVSNLTTTTEPSDGDSPLEIETELDEVNQYFNKLKVFMDQGVDSVLNIEEQTSTIEGYDYMITYSIEEVTYTIYYSIVVEEEVELTTDETTTTVTEDDDDHDEDKDEDEEIKFQLNGLMVINGVNYELKGANEVEDEEQKMWFETVDSNDHNNYVRVEIKNEEGQQKFDFKNVVNGLVTQSQIKFEEEDNETKVELKLKQDGEESSYKFKKEVEDGKTTYKFEYELDGVKGEVKIREIVDSFGNVTYKYDISEKGKHKEIDKLDPDDDDDEDHDYRKYS